MRLLVVEDDDGIADPLVEGLQREGFEVTRVATGGEALDAEAPDAVLLDLRLPDMDGYDVCRELRSRSDVPILIVSARGTEVDRVVGLELGADDYIVKPFGLHELVAHPGRDPAGPCGSGRRRGGQAPSSSTEGLVPPVVPGQGQGHHLGRLVIDRRARKVFVDGEQVGLAPKEFELLSLLAEDPGAVVTREMLLEQVWGPHWYGPTKTVDVHVASLRRKLGHPEWVETVRRVGLRLGDTYAS